MYSGKVGVFGQNNSFSGKKMVEFEKTGKYLGKNGCIRAKRIYLGQRWLHSG